MIHISYVGGKCLLFDVQDIKRARDLGIVGTLSGTLPSAPQQNMFQGVPLQLMVEEAVWLYREGHGVIIPDKRFVQDLLASLTGEQLDELERLRLADLEDQRQHKIKEYEDKMKRLNVKNYKQDQTLIDQSLTITIDDTPKRNPSYTLFKEIYHKSHNLQEHLISQLRFSEDSYAVFKALRQRGYYLAPGLRFGSQFIGYPGDPLRFHAHLMVKTLDYDEDIGMMNIVGGGRLATGVKKLLTLGSVRDDQDVTFYSVEWAGFG